MRYFALATDYDNTIATKGVVSSRTIAALQRVQASGRRIILVTGRDLADLREVFPQFDMFDIVVAENGGVMYQPSTREETLLAPPVRDDLLQALRKAKVEPLAVGKTIVATLKPHEITALEVIRDLGLEMNLIFNKDAVMILPSGVNKATGLIEALSKLGLSPHNVVGIGDAENDHALLQVCEFSAAVANAVPSLQEQVDFVTGGERGTGVRELCRRLLRDDLHNLERRLTRHQFALGEDAAGRPVTVPSFGSNILITGTSGGGKSVLAKVLLERLADQHYQFCVVDPEGDFEDFEEGVVLGDRDRAPTVAEVMQLMRDPAQNAVVNLLGIPIGERPAFFIDLVAELQDLRAHTGRPHWLFLDEAHYLLPHDHGSLSLTLPQELKNVAFITFKPERMLKEALATVDLAFAVGDDPMDRLSALFEATGATPPKTHARNLEQGQAVVWRRGGRLKRFKVAQTRLQHKRHRRKYETGDLAPELSFYFRGPGERLNLRAKNLTTFGQLAEGVDEETWHHHLKRGDFATWFRDVIKDPELADEAANVAKKRLSAHESRRRVLDAINERYAVAIASSGDDGPDATKPKEPAKGTAAGTA